MNDYEDKKPGKPSSVVRRERTDEAKAELVSHFGDKQGQGGGRPRGSKNKLTLRVAERLEHYNFDPIALSVAIAEGKELQTDHPYLKFLRKMLDEIKNIVEEGGNEGIKFKCDRLWTQALSDLKGTYTPIELRSKHIMDLLGYIAPKLKAIEHTIGAEEVGSAQPLSPQEIIDFKNWFEDEY